MQPSWRAPAAFVRRGIALRRAACRVVVAVALIVVACDTSEQVRGSGVAKTEQRSVAPFSEVEVSGAFGVRITIGAPQTVAVSADDNLLPLVKTEVDGRRLRVKTDRSYSSRAQTPTVTITMATLSTIQASGATTVTAAGVDSDEMRVHTSGGANVEASGSARKVTISVSGAANIALAQLAARSVEVQASGAASIEVQVSESLTGSISGAGSVVYSGSPTVSVRTSGVARVSRR